MLNHPIKGELVQARLRRALFGQLTYADVIVRREDGSEAKLGRLSVPAELGPMMVPGSRARFFFHDVAGFRGMHGVVPAAGEARGAFPRLIEDMFGALTMINILLLAIWLTLDGGLRLTPAMMAALGATIWVVFAASRQAIMHDFAFEAGLARASRGSAAQRPRHQLM